MTASKEIRDVADNPTGMRLLIAFDDEYRAYGGAISSAIEALRPGLAVETTGADAIAEALLRFDPQTVISTRPEGPYSGNRVAWIELPPEPDRTAHARLRGRRLDLDNPSLVRVIELLDEAVRLL